jgi:hypothetical protein
MGVKLALEEDSESVFRSTPQSRHAWNRLYRQEPLTIYREPWGSFHTGANEWLSA